ncbi:MAG: type II toxin-antitoxin system VapC family toxin [Candidatus Nanoarchaeia archaeon]
MAEEFYLDTSIWLDVYEKRGKNGEAALKLINKILAENKVILYSDIVIRELEKLGYSQEEIYEMFRIAKPDKIRRVHVSKEFVREADKISTEKNISLADVLHAILTRENYAQLISRDKDFDKLKNITIAKLPEEFI